VNADGRIGQGGVEFGQFGFAPKELGRDLLGDADDVGDGRGFAQAHRRGAGGRWAG
jgi:hypothetical protein